VELVPFLRLLARRPMLVAIGMVVAIAIGVLAAGGKTKESGTASGRVVLDTAKSQLIYGDPSGGDTLGWRGVLLAELAGSRPVTDRISNELGIRRNQLVVVYPDLAEPVMPATLPSRAAQAARATPEKYVLTVRFDEVLPIISLDAQAPDRAAAARLVEAATGGLKAVGTSEPVSPQIQGLVVEKVGPVRSTAVLDRPQPLLGVALAVILFGLWCAGVALVPRLVSAWRSAGRPPQPA
jgi:hypothetical protein